MGDRLTRRADRRRQAWSLSSWSPCRELSLDGAHLPRGRGGFHAEPAGVRHVPSIRTGRVLVGQTVSPLPKGRANP